MSLRHLGVVGAGTMGSGIAETAITHGFEVILYDVAEEILARARERIQSSLDRQSRRRRVRPTEAQAALARLRLSTRLEDLGAAGLIIEAAPEDLALKRDLFAALDRIASPQTILASNTSSLSITRLAEATQHPERVVGMHFFNPAPVMPLVEVIPGEATSPEVVAETMAAAQALGKTPVQARDTPGFIVNRIARPFYLEAFELLGRGAASAEEIDRIMRLAGGFRMGPFELLDLIGLDVNLAVTRSIYEAFSEAPRFRPHPIQEQMVQSGLLGRKTGRGFYAYGKEGIVERRSPAAPAPPGAAEPRRVAVLGDGDLAAGFKAAALAAGWTVRAHRKVPAKWVEREAARALALESIRDVDVVADLSLDPVVMLFTLHSLAPALLPGNVWLSLMLEGSLTEVVRENDLSVDLGLSRHPWLQQVVGIATLPPWQERGLIEILADPVSSPGAVATAVSLFRELGKETALVKNVVGGVFPRIFAMIVNEAAFALGEGVASAADIDTALRLGANYPQGPLVLADEIGPEVLLGIVRALSRHGPDVRYEPAPLLQEIGGAGRGFHTDNEHNG